MGRDVGGVSAILGSVLAVFYALHLTRDPNCLWAIILVIILAINFPWSKT